MFTLGTELVLTPYRSAFEQMAVGAIVVRDALSGAVAHDIRARLSQRSFAKFRLAHRGHFSYADEVEEPELTAGLVELSEFVTQTRLAIVSQRCFRLVAGDYVLSAQHADLPQLGDEQRLIDVIADLSKSSSGEAQIVYALRGEHFFAAPQLSRSISVIERRASVTRYHRYLNHKMGERVVYRHCVTLRRIDVAETAPPSRRS